MGSFKRSLFGYRRDVVEEAIALRDARIHGLEGDLDRQARVLAEIERDTESLAAMVIEREREIRGLRERLVEANECHARSIASLDAVTARLEEMQTQARGQATRIRMKALREAVEVSRRVKELTDAHEAAEAAPEAGPEGEADPGVPLFGEGATATGYDQGESRPEGNGAAEDFNGLFTGRVRLEIGPLGDFSQLVGFEDAVGRLGASEIAIERFSEGRATLSMRLDQPTELLRELEELSNLDFKVRHTAPDNLVLDVDEDEAGEQHAA